MADTWQEAPRRQGAERGDLHRCDRGSACHRGHDAESDGEPLRHTQRGGRQRRTGGVEAVLDHPESVRAAILEASGYVGHQGSGVGPWEAHPETGTSQCHIETVNVCADSPVKRRTGPSAG